MSDNPPEPLHEEPAPYGPPPSPPRRSLTWLWIILGVGGCLLLAMLLLAGAGSAWYSLAKSQGEQALATSHALSTAAAEGRGSSVAAARVTATAYRDAVRTAQAQANAISQAATALPVTQTALAMDAFPPADWRELRNDPFNVNQNQWDIGPSASEWGTVNRAIIEGGYRWSILSSQSDGFLIWSLANVTQRLDEFYLSVEVSQSADAPDMAAGGLLFCYADGDNLCVFVADGDQRISISILKEDKWEDLLAWTHMPGLLREGANRLTILARGNHYKFFVNDTLVQEVDNVQFSQGRVGLAAQTYEDETASFQFDNFKLYAP